MRSARALRRPWCAIALVVLAACGGEDGGGEGGRAVVTPDVAPQATGTNDAADRAPGANARTDAESAGSGADRPDVLLISLDTLRADALSCYGNPRDTTPFIDALAARGVRFSNCYAPSPHTAPSHMSLFTGLLPLAHGIPNASTSSTSTSNLNEGIPTLGSVFSDAGWRVVMVGGRGQLRPAMGIALGSDFHHFKSTTFLDGLEVFDEVVATEDPNEPLFAFFHTYEPHAPYLPPREFDGHVFRGRYTDPDAKGLFASRYRALIDDPNAAEKAGVFLDVKGPLAEDEAEYLRGLYEENVAYTDHLLGRLFELWARHRDIERTLIVLVSDHGEQLGERNGALGHRSGVWQELASVPLIVTGPGVEPRVVDDPVGLTSVPATLLELVGLPPLPVAQPSLLPLMGPSPSDLGVPAFTQDAFGRKRSFSAAIAGLQTIVFEREEQRRAEHFDLARDPSGRTRFEDVPPEAVALRKRLAARMLADRAFAQELPPSVRAMGDDDDLQKRLAELGYTGGDGEDDR
ncbi:Arylsulfatase [Planctomycetes bacterium Pla163]|uniref:Arylsulfatase n=1 Tax=Rohdeia mirabilis TaxID=2528008 RepID=A0A518CYL1_9BACT|nr:Arylsulfatase [Planctomycetes bacterium Pla163]